VLLFGSAECKDREHEPTRRRSEDQRQVTDAATGKGLSGIRVTYKEYSAAITDSTGAFSLNVPSTKVSIMLEGEGYQTKEIALRGAKNIKAGLYEDTYTSFYDVAALPFGARSKTKVPFAATSIQTNGAWGNSLETPSTYLQGKVAGLNAIRRSGTPNIGATLSLRGISSLYASNQPLIIVDGIIFDNSDFSGSIINNHYTDPLSTIDVRDIDNITVIKDGSSTYGTKGANGVIVITTARAKELATRIDFATYAGINFTPKSLPVLNASDYRIYLAEILKSNGMSDASIQALPYMNDNPSNPEYYKYHNNTDWQKEVLNRSYSKNVYLKVTGGDNIAKYALSLGYMSTGGIIRKTDLTRYNMRFNGDLNLSKRLTATTNLSFAFNEQTLRDQGTATKTNPLFLALVKSPLLREKDVSDKGIESPTLADRDTFNISNPLVITDIGLGVNKNYRFLGSIGFNYEISKSFSLSTTLGVTNNKVRENFFIPRKGVTTDTINTAVAFSRLGSQVTSLFSLYDDSKLSYHKKFGAAHELTSRLGIRYLYSKSESDYGLGFNSAIDELVSIGNGVNALRRIGGSLGESNWLNTYFNTDYSYADKYFVSVNAAMDGSSRFGKNIPGAFTLNSNNYAVLPSVAAAWLVSSESFMKGSPVDVLKLRASYGLSGNDDIGNYTARQYYVPQNLLGMEGLVRGGFGNEELQWEKVKKLNAGADVAFLNERINFSVDVFKNKTTNMIAYESVPVASGLPYAITNSAGMTTKGIEGSINTRVLNGTSFKWDLGLTIGRSKSTIDRLPSGDVFTSFAGATYLTRVGNTPNLFYGFRTNGIYTNDVSAGAEGLSIRKADGTLVPFKGGDVRFIDKNSDHVIDDNDRGVIGDPNPDFFGAINTKLEYKRFSLDALFSFVKGNDIYNYTRNQLEAMSGVSNQTEAVLNRWKDNAHQTGIPRAVWGDPSGNARFSDRWIEDGSYFRFRTATLSYSMPFNSKFFKYGVVYVTGNNIFTLTHYKGYDPEFNASESIFGRGIDNALEPQFRSVQLGLRIGL
jgi:TonB-linked SusC/RagA family outer membrane protein